MARQLPQQVPGELWALCGLWMRAWVVRLLLHHIQAGGVLPLPHEVGLEIRLVQPAGSAGSLAFSKGSPALADSAGSPGASVGSTAVDTLPALAADSAVSPAIQPPP